MVFHCLPCQFQIYMILNSSSSLSYCELLESSFSGYSNYFGGDLALRLKIIMTVATIISSPQIPLLELDYFRLCQLKYHLNYSRLASGNFFIQKFEKLIYRILVLETLTFNIHSALFQLEGCVKSILHPPTQLSKLASQLQPQKGPSLNHVVKNVGFIEPPH